jgi:heptosyltransferase-2
VFRQQDHVSSQTPHSVVTSEFIPTFSPQPRRILVRGVNWLGDAVMTTPALLRLRERFPEAHITLLTAQKIEALWQGHPALNAVQSFAAGAGLWSVSARLRVQRFDLALVLPNSPRSALETWLARIPRRVGCARPGRTMLLTDPLPPRPGGGGMQKRSITEIKRCIAPGYQSLNPRSEGSAAAAGRRHQMYDYLHLTAALGANPEPLPPQLALSKTERDAIRQKFGLEEIHAAGTPILGLNPGAEYGPAKRWPEDRFIAAAREIHQRRPCVWLILGGSGDRAVARRIAARLALPQPFLRNLAGQTSLRELMAVLTSCRVLLTNDSGPMHVAAALGTPVVVPFGSTSSELTGPGLPGDPRHHLLQSDAPCAPCFRRECPIDFRCMRGITVTQVVNAVLHALS